MSRRLLAFGSRYGSPGGRQVLNPNRFILSTVVRKIRTDLTMRTVIKILTIILTLITADLFGQTRDNLIINKQKDRLEIDSIDKNISDSGFYFPVTTRIDSNKCIGFDSFTNEWYSKHLRAMNESILFEGKLNKEVFRFTWLRTFHNPIIIRIEKENDSVNLFYKMTNGAGGYEPGEIVIDKRKKLTLIDWGKFVYLVDSCRFWSTMPCEKLMEGLDGSQWILEGATNDFYQVIDKWTPRKGPYYDCCNFLIELTDIKIKKKEKY